MIAWELPTEAMGAFNVWKDDGKIIVDVETSDGGVSAIVYSLFLEKLEIIKVRLPKKILMNVIIKEM